MSGTYKYWLKFTNRTSAIFVLASFYDTEIGKFFSTSLVDVADIGTWYTVTGQTVGPAGDTYPILTLVPGYHINVQSRLELPYLDLYSTNPVSPSILWS